MRFQNFCNLSFVNLASLSDGLRVKQGCFLFGFKISILVKISLLKFFTSSSLFLLANLLFAQYLFAQTEFIENKGQWDKQVKFMTNAGNGAIFLQKKGFTVLQHNAADIDNLIHKYPKRNGASAALQQFRLRSHAYNVQFVGANENPEIIPDKALPSVNNYFIGNDKSKWASDCKIYGGVTYKNVYPNIDVRYYSDAGTRLKYDIIVHPGGNVNSIALQYKGANGLQLKNKELLIKTSLGDNKELDPYTYEIENNSRKDIETKYVIDGDVVKFKVKNHSSANTLIIDPTFVFFTYTGSTADNWGFTATYGPDGSFYSGGIAFGNGYPVTTGAFQTNFGGGGINKGVDIAVMKLSPDGKRRIYATYIGGSGDEQPHSLIVDPQGNLILAGRTDSPNYPVSPSSQAAGGLMDIIVTKLNASGNAIIGSMRIGGSNNDGVNITDDEASGTKSLKRNYGDDSRSEVLLDNAGNIYLASCTQSTNFPTTSAAFQKNLAGKQDAVVLKLNPNCNGIIWSTLLGGSEDDAAYVLALGNNNNVYVAGGTASNNFNSISSSGVITSTYAGGVCDGFITELTNDGSTAIRGTYLGTSAADQIYGIETDIAGNIYVMGTTEGNWTVVNAPYSNPNSKQFISKLDPNLQNYIYSTVFGSGSIYPNISPTAFLVDQCENVYVSGWGGKANTNLGFSNNSSTRGMPVTSDAIKANTDPSGSDFYFIVIKKNAASLLYGTFFGEDNPVDNENPKNFGDHVDGGTSRFDRHGVIYQAMCANCGRGLSFPGTSGTWSTTNNAVSGGLCNLGMLKIEMNFAGVEAGPQASINGAVNDTAGCVPLTVNFTDTIQNAKRYVWDFGDGSPKVTTTAVSVSHTYNSVGYYKVMLVAIDSTTCNVADTAYLTIRAGDNKATLDFLPAKTGLCTDLSYIFTNTSSASSAAFKSNSFIWDFGDGTPRITAPQNPPVTHTYSGPGTYIVKLILSDTSFCNSPDSISKTVRLSPIVKAQFTTPAAGCVPYNAVFKNTSAGGLNFLWDFGDGTTSTLDEPTHLYSAVGNYTIKLYAFDSTSCNKADSTTFTISVVDIPTAAFTYSPNPPQQNTYTNFTNLSIGATNYIWDFGDGDTSTEVNPRHLYNATGTYNVCLIAINNAGCSDTTCMPVSALINPLLDVPSAFTPGKFGINGVVKVRGFGIKEMQWNIYNRWGQKVFASADPANGWDGYFKGKLQPMDVYTYTLDVTFSDGNKLKKTGDITLLR